MSELDYAREFPGMGETTITEHYYLKADHQTEWQEVTQAQFVNAEQAAGFRPKAGCGPLATSGFTGKGMRGRVDYDTTAPQPEPDAGEEWRVVPYSGEQVEIVGDKEIHIAFCAKSYAGRQHAAQIVTDHARAALVPGLVEALESAMKVVSDRAAGGRMITTADEASAIFNKCDAALALVKGRE